MVAKALARAGHDEGAGLPSDISNEELEALSAQHWQSLWTLGPPRICSPVRPLVSPRIAESLCVLLQ